MKIREITNYLESKFPLYLQEDFDNCGVQCGDIQQDITNILVCFDMSEQIIEEAIEKKCNLVISHHPLMLRHGICKIEPKDRVGKILFKALTNNIVLYSMHTNIDSGEGGGNDAFAELLQLENLEVLAPHKENFQKLNIYVPNDAVDNLKNALFKIGCGVQGNYANCCYSSEGTGQFKPLEGSKPAIGNLNQIEHVSEVRLEMIFPAYLQTNVIKTVYDHHPYEEPAFELLNLEKKSRKNGLGRIGCLPEKMTVTDFLKYVKEKMQLEDLRFCGDENKIIEKVAVCGGGGANFIDLAISQNADAYVSGDFKYHDFFKSESGTLLVDIGHYEGEYFIKNIIFKLLKEKFTTFAVLISEREKKQVRHF